MRLLTLVALTTLTLAGCLDSEAGPEDDTAQAIASVDPVFTTASESWSGSVPAPQMEGAFGPDRSFSVEEGAKALTVHFNATYTGLWPSIIWLLDPAGEERLVSSDSCPVAFAAPEVMGSYTCTMNIKGALDAGTWEVRQSWQLGETVEDYSIDLQWLTPESTGATADGNMTTA